jgi:hypothetical protein
MKIPSTVASAGREEEEEQFSISIHMQRGKIANSFNPARTQ